LSPSTNILTLELALAAAVSSFLRARVNELQRVCTESDTSGKRHLAFKARRTC
jgi:hypothetical protein